MISSELRKDCTLCNLQLMFTHLTLFSLLYINIRSTWLWLLLVKHEIICLHWLYIYFEPCSKDILFIRCKNPLQKSNPGILCINSYTFSTKLKQNNPQVIWENIPITLLPSNVQLKKQVHIFHCLYVLLLQAWKRRIVLIVWLIIWM